MCVGCAISAVSAASGFRAWLSARHFGWLTPRRMWRLAIGALLGLAAGDGGQDRELRAGQDGRLEALQEADVFAGQIDVHEPA